MNKWKVWWMIDVGVRVWRVYRLIDPYGPDEPKNREFAEPTFGNKQLAQNHADALNGEKKEDKETIAKLLLAALKATREYSDLVDLQYKCDGWRESIIVKYDLRPTELIDVTADSGIAMITDIIDQMKLERWKACRR